MEKRQTYDYVVLFLIFILAVYLFYKLIEPVMTVILISILLTYISYPLYKFLLRKLQSDMVSRIVTLIVVILVLLLPFSFVMYQLTVQSTQFYKTVSNNLEKGELLGFRCKTSDTTLCKAINNIDDSLSPRLKSLGLDKYVQQGLGRLIETTGNYLVKIPEAILGASVALFITYFLYKDGQMMLKKLIAWLPLRRKTVNDVIAKFEKIAHTIIFSQLFVAFIQGVVGALGFWIFGLPLPIFWGLIMAFFALIPALGTGFIWVPAAAFLVITGIVGHDSMAVWRGVGLFAYGLIVITTIDNVLRARILSQAADIHPIISIVGVLGGVALFGIMGLFLGPILLALLITYFESFRERFYGDR